MQAKIFVSEGSETQRNAAVVEELEQTRQCIRCFAEQELARRRERQERVEAKEAQELDLRRKLDQDRKAVREQLTREASRRFKVNRGEFRKKSPDSKPVPTEIAKSERRAQPPQGGTLEMKVEPVSALEDHPYRLYFNWPALREDHITGKVG